jgi:hypothetical protein
MAATVPAKQWCAAAWLRAAVAATALGLGAPCRGEDDRAKKAAADAASTPAHMFERTRATGIPSLVLVTSRAAPASLELWRALVNDRSIWAERRLLFLVQLPVETHIREIRSLGVSQAPALLLIRRDGRELKVAGQHMGSMDPAFVAGWLALLEGLPGGALSPRADGAVQRVNHASASPQATQPDIAPPPSKMTADQPHLYQPLVPPAAPPAQPPQPMTPAYQQAQPMPLVYAPPQPPIYIQPAAPTIVMGPAPMPNVAYAPSTVPAYGAALPQPMVSPGGPNLPSAQSPSYDAPQTASAPASLPWYAPMPYPTSYATAPGYVPASAPGWYSAAPAQAPMLKAPGLLCSLIGTLGEHLAGLKNPRIKMTSVPVYAPVAPSALPECPTHPAAPPVPPMEYGAVASVPRPSPQDDGSSHHRILRRLTHGEAR